MASRHFPLLHHRRLLCLTAAQEAEGQPDGEGEGPPREKERVDEEARYKEAEEALALPPVCSCCITIERERVCVSVRGVVRSLSLLDRSGRLTRSRGTRLLRLLSSLFCPGTRTHM
jgi:hypothetical protein